MLLHNLDLLTLDPIEFLRWLLIIAFGLIIAITVHEFSHAYVAYKRGDDTAQRLGRVSFNPLAHLDPIGTLMLLVAGFGWGKPVPVNAGLLRPPVRWSMAAVSVAGVTSNMLVAAAIGLFFRSGLLDHAGDVLLTLLVFTVRINIVLAIFNLIPFPPLDGFNIMASLLPESVMRPLLPAIKWGPFLFFGIIIIDSVLPINILGMVIGWPVDKITWGLLGAR